MTNALFDTHCHINAKEFDADRAQVIERMKEAGLIGAMVVACDREEKEFVFSLVKTHPGFLYGAWALHPEYEHDKETSVEEIEAICSNPAIYAVGETGLDYHWCKGDLTWQKERFRKHIQAAKNLNKPLIIHAREAESDALKILKEEKATDVGFVLHCFGGDEVTAKECVDCGGMVSVTGVVTFKNALALQAIVKNLPLENLMIETDCPYMAPVPLRGKRNEPANVRHIATKIAVLKEINENKVCEITTQNALRFFKLDK